MLPYILSRLVRGALTIFGVMIVIFLLTRASGDPAATLQGDSNDPARYEQIRRDLGLDKPLHTQFTTYLGNILQGDFGESWNYRRPTIDVVKERLPESIKLAGAGLLVSVGLGVPLGVIAAARRGGIVDKFARAFGLLGQSIPTFWVGIMLVLIFSVQFGVLPSSGTGGFKHLILPAIAVGWFSTASVLRLTRSAMLDVLDSEYIKMARIKGLSEVRVIWRHALKNASIPIVTIAGIQLAALLTGAVVTESIFAWPGVGSLVVTAANGRDFPLVQTVALLAAVTFVVVNLSVDILYGYLDPRIWAK
jgi:peptide/nickel transport system permease protein